MPSSHKRDPRMQAALDELRRTISRRYPEATFQIEIDPDEPENIDLMTTVDLEDPDEVLDLVIDRLIELQVNEGIPVHVIPLSTDRRVLADPRARASVAGTDGVRQLAATSEITPKSGGKGRKKPER